ncbi:STAS domain-containing protein [Tuwongella immobilis]|uniref:STAS domain-containing protein n=1 Tax=Tuwongella immobilis TaxID=692036 RepID=A0A6C2YLB9_9BACT|nr:STAS domain-containing protein [Tuwongella immobilis]VIP02029.1 Uncharacterized protein OS=Planctomyces maris DSM 8797 GN=PM8797T_26630 PE=4 SV=1: STAS_2 [Tuwongella immobilis]VTS00174.1 Uncharacterized protein OS=Planctomyces maris DSM 8797 GN=PM8797T_26630 PE=4 SV=1: STAS_2 [Tuwongella immobilis]
MSTKPTDESEAFQVRRVGDIGIVTPLGDFEEIPPNLLEPATSMIMGSLNDVTHVVFNVANMRYLPSDFLALLIKCQKRVRGRGGELALCHVTPVHRELLRLTNLDTLWALYDTLDEAISALDGD